jgi:hypothetical protein
MTDDKTEALSLLETLLRDADYRTTRSSEREGVLAESTSRVVWAVSFRAVLELLEGWEAEQAWLMELARERLTVDKAWELYLVLGCEAEPDEFEWHALEAVRQDPSYARKLVVPSLEEATIGKAKRWLAPLEELRLPETDSPPDALGLIEQVAQERSYTDALKVLSAYRDNRPLFEDL